MELAMAKRNGAEVDFAWVLLDTGHASHADRLATLRTKHETGQSYKLSTTVSADSTRALVKVAGGDAAWRDDFKASAVRIFTEADHAEAQAMVEGWDAEKGAPEEVRAG
jgi:hypothetical protein